MILVNKNQTFTTNAKLYECYWEIDSSKPENNKESKSVSPQVL